MRHWTDDGTARPDPAHGTCDLICRVFDLPHDTGLEWLLDLVRSGEGARPWH